MKKVSIFALLSILVFTLILTSCSVNTTSSSKSKDAAKTDSNSSNSNNFNGNNGNNGTGQNGNSGDISIDLSDKTNNNMQNNTQENQPGLNATHPDYGTTAPDTNIPGDRNEHDTTKPNHNNNNNNNALNDSATDDEFVFRMLDDGTWEVCGFNKASSRNITLPTSHKGIAVTKTSISAFQGRNEIYTLTVPGNIKIVDTSSFQCCDNLTSLTFLEGVERLGASTFQSCDKLRTLVVPKSMIDLGPSSFQGCDNLTTVYYAGTESEWNHRFSESYFNYSQNATIYFYSESAPNTGGNYWHYVNNVPTIW